MRPQHPAHRPLEIAEVGGQQSASFRVDAGPTFKVDRKRRRDAKSQHQAACIDMINRHLLSFNLPKEASNPPRTLQMAITFKKLQEYLNAIATNANLDVANSAHGVFWNTTYQAFMDGTVPDKHCNGQPVLIMDAVNKVNSAFNQILRAGWCGMPQMPKTGPFATNANYLVTLSDGSKVTGAKILQDIQDWLQAGAPENG
jgi:hypothetical protein